MKPSIEAAVPAPRYRMIPPEKRAAFVKQVETAVNSVSLETFGGNTPDFVLAEYMVVCFEAYATALAARSEWYREGPEELPHARRDPDDFGPAG